MAGRGRAKIGRAYAGEIRQHAPLPDFPGGLHPNGTPTPEGGVPRAAAIKRGFTPPAKHEGGRRSVAHTHRGRAITREMPPCGRGCSAPRGRTKSEGRGVPRSRRMARRARAGRERAMRAGGKGGRKGGSRAGARAGEGGKGREQAMEREGKGTR